MECEHTMRERDDSDLSTCIHEETSAAVMTCTYWKRRLELVGLETLVAACDWHGHLMTRNRENSSSWPDYQTSDECGIKMKSWTLR